MNLRQCIWALAIAGSANTAAFAADREIKVDDRLDASADTLTTRPARQGALCAISLTACLKPAKNLNI